MPRGAYIRRYICEYVSETINGLKDEHLHLVQSAIENRIMTKKHALVKFDSASAQNRSNV